MTGVPGTSRLGPEWALSGLETIVDLLDWTRETAKFTRAKVRLETVKWKRKAPLDT